jgi:hypothetical protein
LPQAATQYVKGRWWKNIVSILPFTDPERRNFLPVGAIKPWLVTDLAISDPGSKAREVVQAIGGQLPAASITIPTHYKGIFLEGRVWPVFRNPIRKIKDLVPKISEIRSIHLLTVSNKLRDHARTEEGTTVDQP